MDGCLSWSVALMNKSASCTESGIDESGQLCGTVGFEEAGPVWVADKLTYLSGVDTCQTEVSAIFKFRFGRPS